VEKPHDLMRINQFLLFMSMHIYIAWEKQTLERLCGTLLELRLVYCLGLFFNSRTKKKEKHYLPRYADWKICETVVMPYQSL